MERHERLLSVHTADSTHTWHTGTIYSRGVMIPWEACQRCNESDGSLFVSERSRLCVGARENKMSKSNIWRWRRRARSAEMEIGVSRSRDLFIQDGVCVCVCVCVCVVLA